MRNNDSSNNSGLISLISKTNIWNIFKISFSWKWLTPIVYVVLSNYHPEKVPDMDLIKYFKNLVIVLEYFQMCQWNTALWV